MGFRLDRSLSSRPQPGEYTTVGLGFPDAKALLCCKACGALDVLTDGHVIDRGGQVTPAWRCGSCPEVEWLELDSW